MKKLCFNQIPSKLYIFGAGRVAQAVVLTLMCLKVEICGIVVTNKRRNYNDIEGIKVYSLEEYKAVKDETSLVLAVREQYINEILQELQDEKNIYTINLKDCIPILERKVSFKWKSEILKLRDKITDQEYIFFLKKDVRRIRYSSEVNVAESCNLNCQCCNHFSPLAKEKYLDIDGFSRDLHRMKDLFKDKIGKLMLLGGEPLLNPNIVPIMHMSRKILGNSCTIKVITNGLLLPKMKDEFWDECISSNIALEYTKYPVQFDYIQIENEIRGKGISISNESDEKVKTTYKLPLVDLESGLDGTLNYVKCNLANQCIVLKEGRLYPCPIGANVKIFNEYYNKKFPTNQNGIDIYHHDYREIIAFLSEVIPMCQYCDICNYEYNIPWAISRKSITEWM